MPISLSTDVLPNHTLLANLAANAINLTDDPDRFDACGPPADIRAALEASIAKRPSDALASAKAFARGEIEMILEHRVGCTIRRFDNPGDPGWTITVSFAHYPPTGGE